MSTNIEIAEWLDERQGHFIALADTIWANPEVAMNEKQACDLQADYLARDGFTITRDIGDMPTAFMAEWGSGAPIIGFLGEYDALPSLSQKAQSAQEPNVPGGPGHGCGHNLLGTAALASAMALKAWLEATGKSGTVRYYGCPAEETIAGKVFMARAGVFDDLDVAFTWHPSYTNQAWTATTLAVDNLKFRFHGRTSHAGASPELGRSALDAVELMNVGVNYLREHVIDSARIHYVITNGGGQPNVVPDEAEVWYYIRAPRRQDVEVITERILKIAEGAALMTETRLEVRDKFGAYNLLNNRTLIDLAQSVLEELGPIEFTEDELAFAQQVASGYPEATREGALRRLEVPSEELSKPLLGDVYPLGQFNKILTGSTDVGDVSWITPTGQLTTACWAIGVPGHSWGITATSGMSIGHKGMVHAAKAMAIAAATLHGDPELLSKAQAEFREATDGRPYKTPVPEGGKPPKPYLPGSSNGQ